MASLSNATSGVVYSVPMNPGSKVFLPHPFEDFPCVLDTKRKGRRLLAVLHPNWHVDVFMAPSGVALVNESNLHLIQALLFMQCTNAEHSSVGYICIGRYTYRSRGQKRKPFKDIYSGPVNKCFLCIPQGFFFRGEVLFVIFHKLLASGSDRMTVLETMRAANNDPHSFVQSAFKMEKSVERADAIEFIALNQIGGPSLETWHIKQSVFRDSNGLSFLEMRMDPDEWAKKYIDRSTKSFNLICGVRNQQWLPGHGLRKRLKPVEQKRTNNIINHLGLQPLQKRMSNPCNVYICRPRPMALAQDKYSAGHVLEFLTSKSSPFVILVELTVPQIAYVDKIADEFKHMHPDAYNNMLLYCLRKSGRSKIVLHRQTINGNVTETTMVCLLLNDELDPTGKDIVRMSRTVWKQTLENAQNGVLDCDHGFCIQLIYSWPYQKIMNKNIIKLISSSAGRVGTVRYRTLTRGLYQNWGERSTFQCSASMGSHPFTKAHHHQWHWKMDPSSVSFVSKYRNHLRKETCAVAFSSGQILSSTLKKANDLTYIQIFKHCLNTWQHYNTRHRDPDRFTVQESESILSHLASVPSEKTLRFIDQAKSHAVKDRLPQETTCAWTLGGRDSAYDMRQFFANITAGVALDISSIAFDLADQIGSTFLGACFEHCSTRPIWIRKRDGYVTLIAPSQYNYPFAWGDHVERRRARQQQRRNDRARDIRVQQRNQVRQRVQSQNTLGVTSRRTAARSRAARQRRGIN